MTQAEHDQKEIKKYEDLQKEYKKLFAEYEDLKSGNSDSSLIEAKIRELTEKHKEIQELSAILF